MSKFTLKSNLPGLTSQVRRGASRAVRNTAFYIQSHIRLAMAEPKSGAIYGGHQASAPGEAPAIDTGAYSNDIQVATEELSAVIGTNQEQAEVLEFGGVKVQPRPAWGPAFEAAKPIFEAALKKVAQG